MTVATITTAAVSTQETTETRLEGLEKDLKTAIDAEEYEKAAKIRDEIRKMKWLPARWEDKYEQLFDLYEKYKDDPDTVPKGQKNENGFRGYIGKDVSGFAYDGIRNVYNQLADRNNLEDIKKTLDAEKDKANQEKAEKIRIDTEKNEKIQSEKLDRTIWLGKLRDAFLDFQKDPEYKSKQGKIWFINYLKDLKTKNKDTSLTYFGFDSNEIAIENGKITNPTAESIKNEEKDNIVAEEKTEKPEEKENITAEEKVETPEEKTLNINKTRLRESIGKYIDKIKALKTAKEDEKKTLEDDIKKLKEDIKNEKNTYEKVRKDFFSKLNYKFENFNMRDVKDKVPIWRIRYAVRENKLFNTPKLTKIATIRRNITIRTLVKKFNKIGDDMTSWGKNWVRFVMGFEKERFLRYTGIKVYSAIDKAWWAMRMQMDAQDFHTRFNTWRNAIFSILDANTGDKKTEGEEKIIQALKNRINYYGATYARERANARVAPFVDAEKKAPDKWKITTANEVAAV